MSKDLVVDVQQRDDVGKNESRRLRQNSMIPAVVYGGDRPPISITVDPKTVTEVLKSEGGANSVFSLRMGGQEDKRRSVMIRELQRDPMDGKLIHADFVRIDMNQAINVRVPVHPVGVAEGVKNEGGLIDFVQREIEVSCLPGDIPGSIDVDITELHVGQHLAAGDVPLSEKLTLVTDPGQTLLVIALPREEVAAEAAAEAEAEPEAAEEGAEPEVAKKGKEAAGEGGQPEEGKAESKES